ncbi:MAG: endopeptidase La [Chloroflexi bacterium]|nr:endopeptidase La [Chloroflexota bacterium]
MARKNGIKKIDASIFDPEANAFELPLLPVRDAIVFPQFMSPLIVARERSIRAIDAAQTGDKRALAFTQRDNSVQDPTQNDLYDIGTEITIGRHMHLPDGTSSVFVEGIRRVRLLEVIESDNYLRARVVPVQETYDENLTTEALRRAVLALFEKITQLNPHLPEDSYVTAMNTETSGRLADFVGTSLNVDVSKRQALLEASDTTVRLQHVSILLAKELDVLELQSKIHNKVQEEVDKSQREYYLREQMRAIQTELGEVDPQMREVSDLREKIEAAGMPAETREKAQHELDRLAQMPGSAPEVAVIRTFLDVLVSLPWTQATTDNLDIATAAKVLDDQHYGLQKVKERILEQIAVRKLAGEKMRAPILCFVGPPGTGKTSMGRSIAQALGRKFVRVSLGGVHDEAEIRGHRRTYIGAMPGRILQTMRRAGSINPVFMLDEVDKIGADFRGDPSAALLEALDPEQNYAFSDHYLEVAYDLSKVMFITTANILDPVPPALRDRMEVIEFPGYIEEEKLAIARQFLVPKLKSEHGLGAQPKFSDASIRGLIREYTYEAGVRNLERELANICRKVARLTAEEKRVPQTVGAESLFKYLGPQKFYFGAAEESDQIGVATGVAVSEAGGDTMAVEVTLMRGKGNLVLTGQLGEVMQESAQAALSYARAHSKELGLKDNFDKLDIHIHVPEGAIPKDGPSAGITMATALISALSRRPVNKLVAMTGEITLRGRVLPIGGLRDKILAAHRAGLKKMLIPKKNKKDMVDVPKKIQREMKFIFVERMDQVLPVALAHRRGAHPIAPASRPIPPA